jgi:acetoin utilization deacetylase AcuC-like enzyme
MLVITDKRCTEYASAGHPERPARITRTLEALHRQTSLPIAWAAPLAVDDATLLRAHSSKLVEQLQHPTADLDHDTPAHPGIYGNALRSVGGALRAMHAARQGQSSFSLLRPPGHHATADRAMGFCYLNSMAVAALEALEHGVRRVAVLDFDVHHGNGTEDILIEHPHAACYSIHQHPCYPGTGAANVGSNCFNYPVPPHLPRVDYRRVLEKAFADVKEFRPHLLGISAGFDSYAHDTIAEGTLEAEDFHWLGQLVRRLEIPAFSILEGGYSEALPELVLAYLNGLEGN